MYAYFYFFDSVSDVLCFNLFYSLRLFFYI